MIWTSIIYAIIAFSILSVTLSYVIRNQLRISSHAVYYLISILIALLFCFSFDIGHVIASFYKNKSLALVFAKSASAFSMIAMIPVVLFARFLTSKNLFDSRSVIIVFFLFGGVIALTFSSAYTVTEVTLSNNEVFYLADTDFLWIIFDSALPLFAGTLFLTYILRQKKIVSDEYSRALNLMLVGVCISFFLGSLFFTIRKILFHIWGIFELLHVELLPIAFGVFVLFVAFIEGGVRAFYYSSKIYSLHIFDYTGYDIYTATFETTKYEDNVYVPGITAAISHFATEMIGRKVYPREIDFGDYSIIIEKRNNISCFVCSAYPTIHLRKAIQNILKNIDKSSKVDEITELIETYLVKKPTTVQ